MTRIDASSFFTDKCIYNHNPPKQFCKPYIIIFLNKAVIADDEK